MYSRLAPGRAAVAPDCKEAAGKCLCHWCHQARQIHRAAVTDTFLARADLQTHPLLTRTFKHPFCFLSLSLADALCLFLSRSVPDTKRAVSRCFFRPNRLSEKRLTGRNQTVTKAPRTICFQGETRGLFFPQKKPHK